MGMELLETLLTQLFQGINRNNWKRVVAFALVLLALAAGFAFWATLPQT
jgi:hypothetical protein